MYVRMYTNILVEPLSINERNEMHKIEYWSDLRTHTHRINKLECINGIRKLFLSLHTKSKLSNEIE